MSRARTPDTTDSQRIIDAEKLLFRTIETNDPITGKTIVNWVETPQYRDYRARQAAYEAAQRAYAEAHAAAQRHSPGPLRGTNHHQIVKQTHDRWRAVGADKFEEAEALLEAYSMAEAV